MEGDIMKKLLLSTVAALLILTALASVGYAAPVATMPVPFKGSLDAVESQQVQFPMLTGNGSGSGNATHLGLYTYNYEVVVNLLTFIGQASAQFVAANGDRIYAAGSGQSFATDTPNVRRVVETYAITGGTGRFTGVTGSFTVERLINRTTGATSGSFDGYIVRP
jgi:hypothetical protein